MTLDGPFAAGTSGTMKTKQGTRQVQLTEVVPGRSFRLETTVIPLTRFAFECQVVAGAEAVGMPAVLLNRGEGAGLRDLRDLWGTINAD